MNRIIQTPTKGQTPAIVLIDPKYPHNIGSVVRLCSAYGVNQLWFTGKRMLNELSHLDRIPREERLRDYQHVQIIHSNYPFLTFEKKTTVIGVEVKEGAQLLPNFNHPLDAVYVFGPEDDGLPKAVRGLCHQFVIIPTYHCLNLATAVATVLYDRMVKIESKYVAPGEYERRG